MVLPISIMLLEGLDVAMVVICVTRMYDGVTRKWDQGVVKKKSNWYVLRMGMTFPRVVLKFG